jgi:hypothetical protein
MASRPTTRAANKWQHPGNIHTRYDQKRRTTAQIATDNAAEANAQLEAIHAREEKQRLRTLSTAEYEAELWKQVDEQKIMASRPDLEPLPSPSPVLQARKSQSQ